MDFSLRNTIHVQLPDKLRQDQEVYGRGAKRGTYFVVGDRAWGTADTGPGVLKSLGFKNTLSKEGEKQLRDGLYFMECTSLLPLLTADFHLEIISNYAAAPEHATAIKVHKKGSPDAILLFDRDNGLLVGLDYDEPGQSGQFSHISSRYGDFHNFYGGVYSTTQKSFRDGILFSTTKTELIVPIDSFPWSDSAVPPR